MPSESSDQITRMLNAVADGQAAAADSLLQCVYDHLHAIARSRMARERPGHTLQATALVNEVYMRLVGDHQIAWRDRAHFYHAAAEAMRRILVDHARKRGAEKRGAGLQRLPLSVCDLAAEDDPQQILDLDAAMMRLQEIDGRAADVVRLRFFAGLSIEDTASLLDLSLSSVKREWNYARAKLLKLLSSS